MSEHANQPGAGGPPSSVGDPPDSTDTPVAPLSPHERANRRNAFIRRVSYFLIGTAIGLFIVGVINEQRKRLAANRQGQMKWELAPIPPTEPGAEPGKPTPFP